MNRIDRGSHGLMSRHLRPMRIEYGVSPPRAMCFVLRGFGTFIIQFTLTAASPPPHPCGAPLLGEEGRKIDCPLLFKEGWRRSRRGEFDGGTRPSRAGLGLVRSDQPSTPSKLLLRGLGNFIVQFALTAATPPPRPCGAPLLGEEGRKNIRIPSLPQRVAMCFRTATAR